MVGVDVRADQSARVVVDFHFQNTVGTDGEFASSGVRIDGDAVEIGHVGNANVGNGQLQYHDTVAACLGLAFEDVFTTLGVGLTVPIIGVDSNVNHSVMAAVIDGEMKCDDAVATD